MNKFPISKCFYRRLFITCAIIIVTSIIFVLHLERRDVSNIYYNSYHENENTFPAIDQHALQTKTHASKASTNSNSSLEFRDRQQTGGLWTIENAISHGNKTMLSSKESVAYFSHHNNTKSVYQSIDSNPSTSFPFRVINATLLSIPETCRLSSMKNAKLILLWTSFFGTWDYLPQANFQMCSHCRNCQIITDRSKLKESDAVIFHARDIRLFDLPPVRYPQQRWIFYSLESPSYSDFPGLQHMRNMFNWTMTYRTDSDIVSRYGAVVKNQHSKQIDLHVLQRNFAKKYKSVVWMTSHCPTFGGRDEYVVELRKYIDVDVYGTCGTSICPPGDTDKCLQEYADKYKFFLAFENTICKDYITEKLFRNLEYDIIPVVFGGAEYDKFVPPGSYIDALSFQSPMHLALFMSGVGREFKLYSSYFKWRENYSIGIINRKECDLCTMLHKKDLEPSLYNDLRKWWVTDSHCHAWNPK